MKITAINQTYVPKSQQKNKQAFGCNYCEEISKILMKEGGCTKPNVEEFLKKKFHSISSFGVALSGRLKGFRIEDGDPTPHEQQANKFLQYLKLSLATDEKTWFGRLSEAINQGRITDYGKIQPAVKM